MIPFLSFSAIDVRDSGFRNRRGDIAWAPEEYWQPASFDIVGDSFLTAKSHNISTASCLKSVHGSYGSD